MLARDGGRECEPGGSPGQRLAAQVHEAARVRLVQRGQEIQQQRCHQGGILQQGRVKPLPEGVSRGRGGRAGEFCLGLAQSLAGQPGVWALAADTDGIDGVEDNAGALVAPDTLARAAVQGLKAADFLERNDAYGFFSALGDLVVTGPTHTNVNDFRAVLVL